MPNELNEEELLQTAISAGYSVSARQIKRWRMEGLLPRPTQGHPSGHRGSTSLYPDWAGEQLLALLRIRESERRLDEVGFWLWWEGHWIDPDSLRRILHDLITAATAQVPSGSMDDSLFDEAERVAGSVIETETRSPVYRALRRRVGRDESDLFTALVGLLLLAGGAQPIWKSPDVGLDEGQVEVEPEELLHRLVGTERATTDRPGGIGPLLEAPADLPDLFQRLQLAGGLPVSGLADLVMKMSDAELAQARGDARVFAEDLPDIVVGLEKLFGRNALGLGIFRVFRQKGRHTIDLRVLFVPLSLVIRRIAPEGSIDEVADAIQDVAKSARKFMATSETDTDSAEEADL